MRIAIAVFSLALTLVTLGCGSIPFLGTGRDSDEFRDAVKPILEHRCLECHSRENQSGGLSFQDKSVVMATLRSGWKLIEPGNPERSLLYVAVARPGMHPLMMPNDGWKLSDDQLASLKVWIENGAEWPDGPEGELAPGDPIILMDEAP